jgi:hypothetical protein
MDRHSHFHRKKIVSSLLMAYGATKQGASAMPGIAEISQRTRNYAVHRRISLKRHGLRW